MAKADPQNDFGALFNLDEVMPKVVDIGNYQNQIVGIVEILPENSKTGDFWRIRMRVAKTEEYIEMTASPNTYIGQQCQRFYESGAQLPLLARVTPHGKFWKFGPTG